MENKELTIALSKDAIEQIKLWREYAKDGVSFDKFVIELLVKLTLGKGCSDEENRYVIHVFEELLYYSGLLNALLDDGSCDTEVA